MSHCREFLIAFGRTTTEFFFNCGLPKEPPIETGCPVGRECRAALTCRIWEEIRASTIRIASFERSEESLCAER